MRGVWSLEPRSRAALDRTAEGGRPHVGIAGVQSSRWALLEARVLKPEAWGLEPWRRAALDRTAEGGRPHVGIAGGQRSRWALLEARVPGGHCWRPECQVGIAGGQSSEAWGLKPELILHKRFREIGKGLTGDDGARVVTDQGASYIRAANLGYYVAGLREAGLAAPGVMSVAGQHMNGIAFEQPARTLSNRLSPESRQRRSSDLNHYAHFNPFEDAFRALLQDWVALRVSKDGNQSFVTQFHEVVANLGRHGVVTQF